MVSNASSLTTSEEEEREEEIEKFLYNSAKFDDEDDENNIEDDENIDREIQIENQKIFEDFVNKELEIIDARLNTMEKDFRKYYLKLDESVEFDDIYFEISVQKTIIKKMNEIIKNQKSPTLKKFKYFVIKNGELFMVVLQSLKKSVIKIEKALAKLKHFGKFENTFSLLEQQLYSIQLLKDVIQNPAKIPKKSHLLRSMKEMEEMNATNEYSAGISKMSADDDEIYGFMKDEGEYVNLTIYGSNTQKPLGIIAAPKYKFLNEFVKIFLHPKFTSIIIQIDQFEDHVLYVKIIWEKLNFFNIPYTFLSTFTHMHSSILAKAGVEVDADESVVVVLVDENRYVVTEFKYTEKGFLEDKIPRDCDDISIMKHETIEQRILGRNNPAKIILHSNTPNLSSMKLLKHKILKKHLKKVIILEEDWTNYDTKFVIETSKHLLDNRYTKYHILPVSFQNYIIGVECGGKNYPLITCKKDEILPFKETIMIPKTPLKFFLAHADNNKYIIDQIFELPQEAHAYQFTLEVDENNFLNHEANGVISTKVPAMSKLLNKKMDSKIPVIAFHFELSFIYIFDDEKLSYKLLDSWNGKLGRDLFISFDEKKPKFFEKSVKRFQSNCNSVVQDIIQTMGKPLSKTLGYSITSESENPILFKYTNFDGKQKTATPASIMSILLKEHLKVIEKEIGDIPTEIAFSLLDDYDGNDAMEEKNRIKEELKKSCVMINLECSFVDTNFVPYFKDQ